jgi:hypothetical protein
MAIIPATTANPGAQRQTFGYGVVSGANDPELEARDLSSFLDVLHPNHFPLLKWVGRESLRDPVRQVKHEWFEETYRGLSTTTTSANLNNTTPGVAALAVTTGEGLKFRGAVQDTDGPQDIVRITSGAGEELARVTVATTSSISVERGYAGWSTPIDHTAGGTKTITIIGTAQIQGLLTVGASRTTTKDVKYNYTQIFETSLRASATFQATKKYLPGNELDRQRAYELELMAVQFERTLLFGKKQAPLDADPSTMDGIRAVLSTNVYNKAGAALTQVMMEDALEAIWQQGADGDKALFSNSIQLRRIDTFLDAYRQVDYSSGALGNYVETYRTRWGNLTLVPDKNMPPDEILILENSKIGFGSLRALAEEHIAPTSREADVWQWTGEYTSETRLEKSHARVYGLATAGIY